MPIVFSTRPPLGGQLGSLSVSQTSVSLGPTINELFLTPDANHLYIQRGNASVYQYSLSSGDLSTLTFVNSAQVTASSPGAFQRGFFMNADGTRMFGCDSNKQDIYGYTLTTPYDVTAKAAGNTLAVSENYLNDVWFKSDGLTAFIHHNDPWTGDRIIKYTLSTAWNISTATITGDIFDYVSATTGWSGQAQTVQLSSDGTRMWLMDDSHTLFQYTLSVAWDITTATYDGISQSISSTIGGTAAAVWVNPTQTAFYTAGTSGTIYKLD